MVRDFTLDKYRELCTTFSNYKVITVAEFLSKRPEEPFIILRHDIDRMPKNALRMAALEKELGIASTYYFRYTSGAFKSDLIKSIFDMGHEIGYHYETLSKADGDHDEAMKMFQRELNEFRTICDIKTVSMHGRPLSKHVNDDIWKNCSFDEFGLIGDGGLSISGVPYFTDAGRSWDNKNNIRDYVKASDLKEYNVRFTDELIRLLTVKSLPYGYLNIHPERWVGNILEWCFSYSMDLCFNIGKRFVNSIRG